MFGLPVAVLGRLREPVIVLDSAHRITYCNRAAEILYGIAADQVAGSSFGKLIGCPWPPVRGAVADHAQEGTSAWRGWLTQQTHDGQEMRCEVSVVTADGPDGTGGYAVIVHRSPAAEELATALSEREQFDKLLSQLSTKFSGLLNEDVDAAITSGLERLVRFLGVDRSAFGELTDNGVVVTHSYAAPGVPQHRERIADVVFPWFTSQMRAGKTVITPRIPEDIPADATTDRQSLARDGLVGGVAMPLQVGGSPICFLTFECLRRRREWPADLLDRLRVAGEIFANAIARRQVLAGLHAKQQELTHLGRVVAMSELASVIAHELDQPLTAILSNAQATRHLLALPQPDLAESHAALDDIIADTMRASQIVQRERRLLRKGQGAIELLDLNEIVSEIELFIRADARQQRCTCALDLAHGPLQVRADRVQLQQVLINLSRNGIQAMSDQPRDRRAMHIRTRGEGDEVLLEVADCGPGAGEESLERLFEPFFTTKPGGLGMGLAISRAIIQAHHGRIWATRNDAAGLTFHIALARARETQHGGR